MYDEGKQKKFQTDAFGEFLSPEARCSGANKLLRAKVLETMLRTNFFQALSLSLQILYKKCSCTILYIYT